MVSRPLPVGIREHPLKSIIHRCPARPHANAAISARVMADVQNRTICSQALCRGTPSVRRKYSAICVPCSLLLCTERVVVRD
jgi:hypothetical protein